jgi:hypothetical protein
MRRMSENVVASTSHNPKGLHGLYRENFAFTYIHGTRTTLLTVRAENTLKGARVITA